MKNNELAEWIEFRKKYIESMSIDERKKVFPESFEDKYNWEATGIADYIRVRVLMFIENKNNE